MPAIGLLPLAEDVERSVRAVSAVASSEKARVRLATPSGMSRLFVHGLARLRDRHPEVVLEIISGSRLVDLRRGEADLAVRVGPVTDAELVVKKLCELGQAVYAARSYLHRRPAPIDVTDLAGHDVVAFDPALAATPAARWLDARSTGATIVLRSREMTDMLIAIASGLGIGVLPCFMADAESDLVRLTRQPVTTTRLSLVYRREARIAPPIRLVAELVMTSLQQQAARLLGR